MLADRLLELRTSHNYTKKSIADKLKMSPEGYGYYESGKRKPSPEVITSLANIYSVSTDYLLGNTDDPAPPSTKKEDSLDEAEGILKRFIENRLGREPDERELSIIEATADCLIEELKKQKQ